MNLGLVARTMAECGLAVWFLTSVLFQYRGGKLLNFVKRWDHYSLIPRWTFFAPNPYTHDFEILFRNRYPDSTMCAWTLHRAASPSHRNGIWNPAKRSQKAIIDLCGNIMGSLHDASKFELDPAECLAGSSSYQALQKYVQGLPNPTMATERQFTIVLTEGYRKPNERRILLVSPFLPLPQ